MAIYLTAGANFAVPGTRKPLSEWLDQYSEMAVNALINGLTFDKPVPSQEGHLWLHILKMADQQDGTRNFRAIWRGLVDSGCYEASYRAFMFEIEKLRELGGIEGL